jgi:hypothetical protein
VMTQAQDWLKARERLKPKEDEEEGDSIMALRKRLKDPEDWVEEFENDPGFIHAMTIRGWLPPIAKKPRGGRPTAEEAKLKQKRQSRERALEGQAEQDDDSDLQRMLRAATQNSSNSDEDEE